MRGWRYPDRDGGGVNGIDRGGIDMSDSIEDQMHFMLAIEHLATARLELHAATKHHRGNPLIYSFEAIDKAMKDIVMRVRS